MLVPAIFERHAPELTPHFSPTRRSISEVDEQWYEVEAIIDHRYVESNLEYLVAWKPAHDGTAYEPSWEPAAFANASLRRSYHQLASLPPIIVSADVRPLIGRALRAVWAAVTLAKTRARPRVHEVLLPEISLPELGAAFLTAVASPWLLRGGAATGDPLPVLSSTGDDGVETKEVVMTELAAISALCGFHHYSTSATGLLHHTIGRESDGSMLAVGMPVMLKVTNNRRDGLVTTSIQFPTVLFNGGTGEPQPPPATKGMLKKEVNKIKLTKFVRALTPATHPLAVHGWTAQPDHVLKLPNPINLPT